MLRGLITFVFLAAGSIFGGNTRLLALLPNGAVSNAIQVDAAGNIYVAGYFAPGDIHDLQDAFVAKLSADGSKVLYFTPMSGTQADVAGALTLGSDGSAYVAGYTLSSDFPATNGAFETTHAGSGQTQGFLAKVSPAGVISYSTYVNGGLFTVISGISLDSAGDVFLTGVGGPAATTTGPARGFILKFDPTMSKVLLSISGWGGGLIQLGRQANIYVAGSAQPDVTNGSTGLILTLPSFPGGAFQPTHSAQICRTFGSGPSPGGLVPCHHQYVAKLSPTGTVLWATYVTGTYGAIARGMTVDSVGNVIVAGTTNSDDYPVTTGAFQTAYAAAAPPFPVPFGSTYKDPPPATGYVTKINATGTALIWSTYFGGSTFDEITGVAVGPTGDIFVSGRAASGNLPAVAEAPPACHPVITQVLGFVARLASDGAKVGSVQLVTGAPDCSYLTCPISSDYGSYLASWPLALRPDGTALTAGTDGTVASINFSSSNRLACMTDPADNVQLRKVAPGQLLSIFGTDLAPALPFNPPGGASMSTTDFGVYFNGIPAPILYSSAGQINVQVPFEIAGQTTAQMQVMNKQVTLPLAEAHAIGVVDRQPAIFLSPAAWTSSFPGYVACGGTLVLGEAAMVLNEDGALNDCTNPAAVGSTVTVFVNGLGQVMPALTTGTIARSPAATLTPGVDAVDALLSPVSTNTASAPGSITGVSQVQFEAPAAPGPGIGSIITPSLMGKNLRERLIVVWTRPK